MGRTLAQIIGACGLFMGMCVPGSAAQADGISVRDGLVLSLDARVQGEMRRAGSLPMVRSNQPLDMWLDNSGKGRQAIQLSAERRPVWVGNDEAAYVVFDGKDDYMSLSGARELAADVTLFVLAAPRSNAGGFSAILSMAETGKNDYTSGLNVDFGPLKSGNIDYINVESAGASGARDLLSPGLLNAAERPFGDFHVFTVRSRIGKAGIETFLDGLKAGERERLESLIGLDQILIGARLYSNDPAEPPYAQGYLDGAISQILIYSRAVSEVERRQIEEDMLARIAPLQAVLHGEKGHGLSQVKDPPAVQMLVPGFSVREVPIKTGNLNNVRYRWDGKVVGLGYDGRIHLLSDTDGDGLEDRDELFWEGTTMRGPIGMALLPKDDPRGDGVIVASKGKVSLFLDKDRNGRAEEERIIASGWRESFHSVDTLGVAIDPRDGSVYFGLGCANFTDAYLIDKSTGKSHYDVGDVYGTIQRLSADFKTRETICTGVRFTCALAFNGNGDLFATDQEGATWLSNGNPLDELLHIRRGMHYGFPPRHPKYLPGVRDEPAVSEYGPQHQSAVGMVFNEGVNGGPPMGPAHWKGDAIVCGESRGKIWRTRLAKTPMGYVAENHLIACLTMLTVDACVSPKGDLLVACHSGPPDWGTGPGGEGRLFKIRYEKPSVPQPVRAWASATDEVRIAFDRQLEPADWSGKSDKIRIEAGEWVRPGDRFEVVRPGYQVVRDQMAAPRQWVRVLGLGLTEDRRTIRITVPRQTQRMHYAITLPVPESWRVETGISQYPEMELDITLDGVLASVVTPRGETASVVIPHPSLAATVELAEGSADHETFLRAVQTKGAKLSLSCRADVTNPFLPAVQPGSKLDWEPKKDPIAGVTYRVTTDYGVSEVAMAAPENGAREQTVMVDSILDPRIDGNGMYVAHDGMKHLLSTGRIHVPWSKESSGIVPGATAGEARKDVSGNWLHGRRLFNSKAGCSMCHAIRNEGTEFGPNLSNLIFRDRESVLRDILKPTATINPDQIGSEVRLKDGTVLRGLARGAEGGGVLLAIPGGGTMKISREKIGAVEPMKESLMPSNFADVLDETEREDLLTFLLTNPLEPAEITRIEPAIPAARSVDEVTEVLGYPPVAAMKEQSAKPIRILLCAGPKDHGLNEHDYPVWLERWSRLLALADGVSVSTATGFPSAKQLAEADVAVFYNGNPGWNQEKAALMDTYHDRGGGVVYLHYAVDGGGDPEGVAERMGLAFTLGSKFRHGEFDLVFAKGDHPITKGVPTMHFTDETYWGMRGRLERLQTLANVVEEGELRPELWVMKRRNSRIVGCVPGHYTWTFDDPLFRVLVLRSICWAAGVEDVDRLAELAVIGARVAPSRAGKSDESRVEKRVKGE